MTRRLHLVWASFLASLIVLALVTPARADDPMVPAGSDGVTVTRPHHGPESEAIDARFDVGMHALYSVADLDGRLLDATPAFKAANLRFQGRGAFTGGALSGTFVYARSFRFGTTISAFAVPSLSLRHAQLSSDLSLSLEKPYGFTVDCTPGWEWHLGRFVPHVGARLGVAIVATSIDVQSIQRGAVQTLSRDFRSAVVAPELGLQLRLNDWAAIDVAASISPVGLEMLRLSAGLTFKMNPGG